MAFPYQYGSCTGFRPLPSEAIDGMLAAVERFIAVTRPRPDFMRRLDGDLIAAELSAAKENVPALLLAEIEVYIQAVLDAATSRLANQLLRPPLLQPLSKSKEQAHSQRVVRGFAARLLYLRALDPDTAVMSAAGLSRVKSQAWQDWKKFDLGIVLPATCTACGTAAALTVRNVHEPRAYRFNCSACGHHYHGDMGALEIVADCSCTMCANHKNELLNEIISIIDSHAGGMIQRYADWRKIQEGEVGAWPSRLEMERDYKMNRDNVGKDVRAILSLLPVDAADFEACLERFLKSHRGTRSDILGKAVRENVLYSRLSPEVPHSSAPLDLMAAAGKDTMWNYTGVRTWGCGGIGENGARKALAELLDRDIVASDLLIDAAGITIRQTTQTENGNKLVWFRLLALEGSQKGLLEGEINCRWDTEKILNPYFTGIFKPLGSQEEELTSKASPLFNSRTEGQAYSRIANENPGCIVVPNRLLKRIVNLDQLKPALENREFDYAKNAEIDFVVYDEDGRLLFVEEMQRGGHHNLPEWIWKDAVKRKVMQLAGIRLRESF